MEAENKIDTSSRAMVWAGVWAGRIVSILAILFLLMDAVVKLVKPAEVLEINKKLGYAESAVIPIGIILLICTLLYAFPRTAVLGAILVTGYLGGAVATQLRVSSPETNQGFGGEPFNIIFPFIIGAFVWGGLYLRNARLRSLVPLDSGS